MVLLLVCCVVLFNSVDLDSLLACVLAAICF